MTLASRTKSLLHSLFSPVRAHQRWLIGGAIVAFLIAGGSIVLSQNGTGAELYTVTRQDFKETVTVSGTVTPATEAELGFAQSGRIAGVYAVVGQRVARGALLAEVENGDAAAAVAQKEAALAREKAKLDALMAGTRAEEIAVKESAVASAEVALVQAKEAVHNAIRDAYAKSDDAIRNQADQFFTNPRSTKPELTFITTTSLEAAAEAGRVEMERLLVLWQGDVRAGGGGDTAEAARRAAAHLSTLASYLSTLSAALEEAIATSGTPQPTLDGWSDDIADARVTTNSATSALTSAVTAERNAAASLDTAKKNLALARAGTTPEDIAAKEAEVKAAEADLRAARAALGKTVIRAPFAGVVSRMDAKVGETASPGTPVAGLMSEGRFHVETYIPEISIASVAVGNSATVTLDAYGANETFGATVIALDPAETLREGVTTYKTMLQFDDADSRIRSGLSANIAIETGVKEQAIVVPKGAIAYRNGQSFVLKRVNGDTVEVPVTIGKTSALGQTEVTTGLEAGDVIVLNP
jgi:HlyD family secretion protein